MRQRKPGTDQIVCPVIAMLFNNGTLVPRDDGLCTQEMLQDAIKTLGMEGGVILNGATADAADGPINIFTLNRGDSPVSHLISSGFRNPGTGIEATGPNIALFDEFVKQYVGSDGKVTPAAWARFVKKRKTLGQSAGNKTPGSGDIEGAMATLMSVFGREPGGK
jgi:hypothetical protein